MRTLIITRIAMKIKPQIYVDNLTAQGEIAFTVTQFRQKLDLNYNTAINALDRLRKKQEIVSYGQIYSALWRH